MLHNRKVNKIETSTFPRYFKEEESWTHIRKCEENTETINDIILDTLEEVESSNKNCNQVSLRNNFKVKRSIKNNRK